ncbi:hypothetical protein ACFY3M_40480 [Streptomyces mirabilis]|uniref:hypothetical protein n=1 Tax=Streptomyces mirabilis TaxID=68239 RepID=UPI003686423E
MRGADRCRHVLPLSAFVFVETTAGSQGVHAEQPCQQPEAALVMEHGLRAVTMSKIAERYRPGHAVQVLPGR